MIKKFLLLFVFLIFVSVPAVQAELACVSNVQLTDSPETSIKGIFKYEGKYLLYHDGGVVHFYDVTTMAPLSVPAGLDTNIKIMELQGDTMAWIDQTDQVHFYNINTQTGSILTTGPQPSSNLRMTGDWVLWTTLVVDSTKSDLWAYNAVSGETFRVVRSKKFSFIAEGGHIFWSTGNALTNIKVRDYDLATKTQTLISDQPNYSLMAVDEGHMVWHNNATSQLSIQNRATGASTVFYTYPFRTQVVTADIDGDYVGWSTYTGLAPDQAMYVYQISTGEMTMIVGNDYTRSGPHIEGRFLYYYEGWGQEESDKFFVYDLHSEVLSPLNSSEFPHSHQFHLNRNNWAWAGNQGYDFFEEKLINPQLFLATNCGMSPVIISQSYSMNVISGRSLTLDVEAVGDEIMMYQWYQGQSGDTSTPVGGATLPTYTTPALTETVSYWVQIMNGYGVTDSETITLTPDVTAEVIRDGSFENPEMDAWLYKAKNPSNQGQAAASCNTETLTISHTGQCALRLIVTNRAFPLSASQQIDTQAVVVGDTLTLSLWGEMRQASAPTKVVLKVMYADSMLPGKVVIKVPAGDVTYTEFSQSLTVTAPVAEIKLTIKNRGESGIALIDDVSVIQSAGTGR